MKKFLVIFLSFLFILSQIVQAQFINIPYQLNVIQADSTIVYTGSLTDATNQASAYTFAGANLGNPAPNRVMGIICANHGNGALRTTTTITLDGSGMTEEIETGQNPVNIAAYALAWPTGTTGTFVITTSGSMTNIQCATWAIYTLSGAKTTVDAVSGVATTTTNCANTDLAIDERGASIAGVGAGSNSITNVLTWNGTDIFTEDFEASIESTDSMSAYSAVNNATTTTNDIDNAESATSNRACVSVAVR